MDRDAKRKGAPGASPDGEGRAAKRQKGLGGNAETPESTTEAGLDFMRRMKAAKDKTGRPISTPFLSLPKPGEVPGYYEEVKMPMALDTIEAKLNARAYPTLAALESDVKRMVTNAKTFNDKTSAIYLDAERLRKTASNWMTENNPAYRDPNYAAVATPIPGEAGSASYAATPTSAPATTGLKIRGPNPSRAPPAPTPSRTSRSSARDPKASSSAPGLRSEFAGKSFQQAQLHIIEGLINKTEDGIKVFEPFKALPSRQLRDYYHLIKYPVSLDAVRKKVQGVQGRNAPTNITMYGSWDAMEEDISFVWRNARTYNEDGSEISNLADELEGAFFDLLEEAKKQVNEPQQATMKLKINAPKQPPSIKLRLGARENADTASPGPATPAARSSATPGVIVDNASLARQQQHVATSVNGQRAGSSVNGGRSVSATSPHPSAAQSGPSPPIGANGVKSENHAPSPALGAVRPVSNGTAAPATPQIATGSMPPPSQMLPHGTTSSPYPNAAPAVQPAPQYYAPRAPSENRYRLPGHEVILPNIQLSTNPAILRQTKPWKYNIPASNKLAQQQITITLPSDQHLLQAIPTIPVANTSRPWRLFVHVNGSKLTQAIRPGNDRERDRDHPPFDVKLVTGVNRIDVELLAGSEPKKGKKESEEVLREMCTIYVHLLRT